VRHINAAIFDSLEQTWQPPGDPRVSWRRAFVGG
jgi:hypothetical protein